MASGSPADRDLLAALAKEGFQGPMWDRFAHELAVHGISVIREWIMNGRIRAELRARKIRHDTGGGRSGTLTAADATGIAVETTARAIVSYRDTMLLGRWPPEGGASITTSFITHCLVHFPSVRRWWRDGHRTAPETPDD